MYLSGLAVKLWSIRRHSIQGKCRFLFPILSFCIPTQKMVYLWTHFLCVFYSWLWNYFLSCFLVVVSENSRNIFLWFPCCFGIVLPFYLIFPNFIYFLFLRILSITTIESLSRSWFCFLCSLFSLVSDSLDSFAGRRAGDSSFWWTWQKTLPGAGKVWHPNRNQIRLVWSHLKIK